MADFPPTRKLALSICLLIRFEYCCNKLLGGESDFVYKKYILLKVNPVLDEKFVFFVLSILHVHKSDNENFKNSLTSKWKMNCVTRITFNCRFHLYAKYT